MARKAPQSVSQPGSAASPVKSRVSAWGPLLALGLGFVILAVSSLIDDSVTIDEFGHLPVGYKVLTTGNFDYCTLNPPLMNVLSALPLLLLDMTPQPMPQHPRIEPGHGFWANGYDFMFQHAGQYQRLYIAARCMTVALVGLLGVLAFLWARKLAPERPNLAGLLAAGLIWFSPNMLAHARLVTTDAGAACFTALVVFAFHAFLRRPTPWRIVGAGVALGLAQLVKFNAVLLYPALLAAAVIWRLRQPAPSTKRLSLGIAGSFAVSVFTINAGYFFQHTFPALASLQPASRLGVRIHALLPGSTRVPLPRAFISAFDQQLADSAEGDPSYLFGNSYDGGRWYYFPALVAIKTPIPLLLIAGLAVATVPSRRRLAPEDAAVVLLPAAALLLALSLFSNKQIGLRMLLPAAPLFWIWASASIARLEWRRWLSWIIVGLALWLGVEVAWTHPHYLAYFNSFVGGPTQGHRYALDSNLDWGQDLIRLKRYLDKEGASSVQLLYFGRVDPSIYGLKYTVPTKDVGPGLFAISVSLRGRGYIVNDHGRLFGAGPIDPSVFGDAIATIGHTIQVYRIAERPR